MFGYATNETEECMPLTVALAHRLNQKMAELRRSGECAWLRPDSKTQVTIEHELRDGEVIPLRVHTVVISVQHSECISLEDQREQLKSKVYIMMEKGKIRIRYSDCQRRYPRRIPRREHHLLAPAIWQVRHWRSAR